MEDIKKLDEVLEDVDVSGGFAEYVGFTKYWQCRCQYKRAEEMREGVVHQPSKWYRMDEACEYCGNRQSMQTFF